MQLRKQRTAHPSRIPQQTKIQESSSGENGGNGVSFARAVHVPGDCMEMWRCAVLLKTVVPFSLLVLSRLCLHARVRDGTVRGTSSLVQTLWRTSDVTTPVAWVGCDCGVRRQIGIQHQRRKTRWIEIGSRDTGRIRLSLGHLQGNEGL